MLRAQIFLRRCNSRNAVGDVGQTILRGLTFLRERRGFRAAKKARVFKFADCPRGGGVVNADPFAQLSRRDADSPIVEAVVHEVDCEPCLRRNAR